VPSTSRPAATRAASTAVTASAPRTVTPTARCDGRLGAAGARTERHSQTASPTPATAQVPFAVLEAFQLRQGARGPRERHIGAAQPGAHPTWDLSSVTMVQLMADLGHV
jgi:hypothetical protein